MRDTTAVFGPPGTGKTTYNLDAVAAFLAEGGKPERVAFNGFSRRAAHEGAERAAARFGFAPDDLPWFRTLHSTAFRQLGLKPTQVMTRSDWREVGRLTGWQLETGIDHTTERLETRAGGIAERLLHCYSLARARCRSIEAEWRNGDWDDLPLWAAVDFARKLDDYKQQTGKLDFTDFLDRALDCAPLDVDLFVLDEAQDLTAQQWRYARHLAQRAAKVIISGDDDQAIMDFGGADAGQMRRFRAAQVILPVSHRLPRRVWRVADRIVSRIRHRVPKRFEPRDAEGEVEILPSLEHADLDAGQWLILCRHRRTLDLAERLCRQRGYVYRREGEWSSADPSVRAAVLYERLRRGETVTLPEARLVAGWVVDMVRPTRGETLGWQDMPWSGPARARVPWYDALTRLGDEDVAYTRALLRRGESLSQPGRISLSTIHAAKGGEADNVLIYGEANKRVRAAAERDPDAENRVWYVGVTRARSRLVVVGPPAYLRDALD